MSSGDRAWIGCTVFVGKSGSITEELVASTSSGKSYLRTKPPTIFRDRFSAMADVENRFPLSSLLKQAVSEVQGPVQPCMPGSFSSGTNTTWQGSTWTVGCARARLSCGTDNRVLGTPDRWGQGMLSCGPDMEVCLRLSGGLANLENNARAVSSSTASSK